MGYTRLTDETCAIGQSSLSWIDSDVFTYYQIWADEPDFVVKATARVVELIDYTLQYALPQLR